MHSKSILKADTGERGLYPLTQPRTFRKLVLLCAIGLAGSPALADPLTIINPNFAAVPVACGSGYAYQASGGSCGGPQQDFNGAPGFGWTFNAILNGLTGPGTAFNPPSFSGLPFAQAVFLQGDMAGVSQSVGGFIAGGSYILTFFLGSRFSSGAVDGNQTVEALIGGNVIGTFALSSFTPFTLETVPFSVSTSGNQTLQFIGVNSGDHTAFLSDVAINGPIIPEPATLTLFGVGLAGLGLKMRRKKVV